MCLPPLSVFHPWYVSPVLWTWASVVPACSLNVDALRLMNERLGAVDASTDDRWTVGASRVGACYVASVGRVRVAGACPQEAVALACECAVSERGRAEAVRV